MTAHIHRIDEHRIHFHIIRPDHTEANELVRRGLAWWRSETLGDLETRLWLLPMIRKAMPLKLATPALKPALAHARATLMLVPMECTTAHDLGLPLRPYQRSAAGLLLGATGAVLADDVGLGKTIASGTAMYHRLNTSRIQGNGGSALVCTTNSTKHQWFDELSRLYEGPTRDQYWEPRVTILDGQRAAQRRAISRWAAGESDILILHHDALRCRANLIHETVVEMKANGETVGMILDEASVIKNPSTKIWAAATTIGKHLDFRWALTATPIENKLSDLWGIADWTRPGYFGPFDSFEALHVVKQERQRKVRSRWGGSYLVPFVVVVGHRHQRVARSAFRPLYLRRTCEDISEQLPAVTVQILDLTPTISQIAEAEKVDALMSKQLVLNEIPGKKSPKVDAIKRLMDSCPDQAVICTESKRFAVSLCRHLAKHNPVAVHGGIDARGRQRAARAFTDGTSRVLVMTKAGERGLNLQAGSLMIHADLPFNPARLRQRVGRCRRLGSAHRAVRNVFLIMRGTHEATTLETLGGKNGLADEVLQGTTDDVSRAITQLERAAPDLRHSDH